MKLSKAQITVLKDIKTNKGKLIPCSYADLSWNAPYELRQLWDDELIQRHPFEVISAGKRAIKS